MPTIGLTGVLASLSLATDLGSGFAPEKGLRVCLAALAVGRQAGMDDGELADVFQGALLQSLGCTAYASENAAHFDDDLAFQVAVHQLDVDDPATFAEFGAWAGEQRAATLKAHFMEIAPTVGPQAAASACEAARALATKLGLRPNAITALEDIHERWDGRGFPGTARGEQLTLVSRTAHLAEQAVIAYGTGDATRALSALQRRSGGHLDPELVAVVLSDPEPLLAALQVSDPMTAAIAAEPPPKARIDRAALGQLAEAFGDLADLKSRFTLGHSRGVATLAARAGGLCGMSDDQQARLLRIGLVHDVGRTSVSTGIWERPGPLSAGETDQVRLHGYWSERVLARSDELSELALCAGSHHERLDGSGYHRGIASMGLSRESRLLAAADVMHALREHRPHRPAVTRNVAVSLLTDEARAGRLDPDAVAAVIEASGVPRPRAAWPADLTDREVEVLRLAAQGLTNKQIADQLVVSPRTVQHHLAHVYDKTGRRTRAGNALFAMEHGLLDVEAEAR